MYLIIDQGNSFTKIAVFNHNRLFSLETLENSSIDKITSEIDKIKSNYENIQYAMFSSVLKNTQKIFDILSPGFTLVEMSHSCFLPIEIEYATPETLGLDRIAAATGACSIYPTSNILTIDAGTCITYDFTNSLGKYLGGGISPGIQMRFDALHTFTSKLPLVSRENIVNLIGSTTKNSILSGVLIGITAEIDGIIDQYRDKFPDLKIILTGGDANYFDKKLKNDIFAVPNLVLMGLRDILLYNVEK